ncbi:hypothetical protein HY988_05715 [Candidatus Micrarchaeota archaeon]|nr:hypothetical protein [Candidatus Micrarchaeota archaeon]
MGAVKTLVKGVALVAMIRWGPGLIEKIKTIQNANTMSSLIEETIVKETPTSIVVRTNSEEFSINSRRKAPDCKRKFSGFVSIEIAANNNGTLEVVRAMDFSAGKFCLTSQREKSE